MLSKDDATTIPSDDDRLGWRGVSSLCRVDDWSVPWRVDDDAWLRHTPLLHERARMAAGSRWEFTASGVTEIRFNVDVVSDDPCSPIDIVRRGSPPLRVPLRPGVNTIEFTVEDAQRVSVWWPQYGSIRIGRVHLRADCGSQVPRLAAATVDGPHWIAYGSSITQCRTAPGPTETWPALVARELEWDLTCLGFGGQAHLDPAIARSIRDRPADVITLCVGVNIQGASSMSARTLKPSLAEFVRTIREGHPLTPLIVISPICSPGREDTPNVVDLTLADVRGLVHDTVAELRAEGDEHLAVIDGLSILGSADAEMLEDGLHPDAEGYRLMAERLGPRLQTRFARLTTHDGPSDRTNR